MSRSVRARCISGSLVVLSCLSGQIVLGQTATLESASPAAVERAVATPDANAAQAPGPGLLGPTTTTWPGKTPNFFKATLTDFRNLFLVPCMAAVAASVLLVLLFHPPKRAEGDAVPAAEAVT